MKRWAIFICPSGTEAGPIARWSEVAADKNVRAPRLTEARSLKSGLVCGKLGQLQGTKGYTSSQAELFANKEGKEVHENHL